MEATDGSFIEEKESAMVWHHQEADHSFGSWLSNKTAFYIRTNTPKNCKKKERDH
jgi:trehalose-6-phosphatase